MTPGLALATAALEELGFAAKEPPVGNLTWGEGRLDGRVVRVVRIENRIASGSIGRLEAERLIALLRVTAAERSPLVLLLDSAGARVSEGLGALGAFRALYRAALDAALSGAPIACILGRNAYGGSSMLAMVASERLLSAETQLAMSGPAILASSAGAVATDEAFQAMAQATTSAQAREKAGGANRVWHDGEGVMAWLRQALAPRGDVPDAWHARHEALALRFDPKAAPVPHEALQRRDLARLYDGGYEIRESQGLLEGRGVRGGEETTVLGLVGSMPLGIARAWAFAERAWRLRDAAPGRLEVLLDCATHAARLDDERAVLSEFIVDMAFALSALRVRGWRVALTVLGKAGGGVYVALAAPADRVASVHGADIQVLPAAAVAAILGEGREVVPSFADYRAAGVAGEEIKLGLIPGNA
jgi:hypothetical protein